MTDQTTPLRDRIAAAIRAQAETGNVRYEAMADAVLTVLPAPVDRAAVLREAADEIADAFGDPMAKHIGATAASWLRRRARQAAPREAPNTLTPHGEPIDIGWINGTLDARLHLSVRPDMDLTERDQLLADLRDTIGALVPVRPARAQQDEARP